MRRRPGVTPGRSYFSLGPVGRSCMSASARSRLGSPLLCLFRRLARPPDRPVGRADGAEAARRFRDLARQTCLHLLAAEDLALVWIWSPTYFTEILRAMRRNMATLLPDWPDAGGNAPADAVRARLETWRKRSPSRKATYRRSGRSSTRSAAGPMHRAQVLRPNCRPCSPAFIQSKGLMSTEAAVSFPYGDGPGSILAARSGFFEFVDDGGASHFAWQLEVGRTYRLIVTTGSGLYRYDTQDMVKVVGFSGDTPRLQFIGRAGMVSDLCGEKLTEAFVAVPRPRSGSAAAGLCAGRCGNRAASALPPLLEAGPAAPLRGIGRKARCRARRQSAI